MFTVTDHTTQAGFKSLVTNFHTGWKSMETVTARKEGSTSATI